METSAPTLPSHTPPQRVPGGDVVQRLQLLHDELRHEIRHGHAVHVAAAKGIPGDDHRTVGADGRHRALRETHVHYVLKGRLLLLGEVEITSSPSEGLGIPLKLKPIISNYYKITLR